MSKPISNTPITALPFEQRLKLVSGEIASRTAAHSANKRNATRARLWVRWIKQNILESTT